MGINLLQIPKGAMTFLNISYRLWNVLLSNIDVNVSITTFNFLCDCDAIIIFKLVVPTLTFRVPIIKFIFHTHNGIQ